MRLEAGGGMVGGRPGTPDPVSPQTWEMGWRTAQEVLSGSGHYLAQPRPTGCDGYGAQPSAANVKPSWSMGLSVRRCGPGP